METNKLSRITVYHIKGGVGKTRIALNLALTLDFGVITNDTYSIIEKVLPKERRKILKAGDPLPAIPPDIPIIFDLGGYPDARAIEAIRQSQFILTPLLYHKEDLQIGLDFIQEIKKYNENIIIIINKSKADQFRKIENVCRKFYEELPVFAIKKSKAMSLIVEQKNNIREIANKHKWHKRYYDQIADQFEVIINYMLISLEDQK